MVLDLPWPQTAAQSEFTSSSKRHQQYRAAGAAPADLAGGAWRDRPAVRAVRTLGGHLGYRRRQYVDPGHAVFQEGPTQLATIAELVERTP